MNHWADFGPALLEKETRNKKKQQEIIRHPDIAGFAL